VHAYEEFARRMAAELDLGPAAETRALADAIRARESAPAATPVDPRRIAVLPFAVRGDPRYAYLGEGLVDLLATKLDGAGELHTVDPRALLGFLAGEAAGEHASQSADRGRRVAEHFGAGRFLMGTLVEAAGRLEATARLYDLRGRAVAGVAAAAESERELFELVDELARHLLAAAGVNPGTRLSRIAALTTESLDALRSYLLGERALRAGRYFDAMEGFQAAVDADGSFALAHYRLAAAAAGCALYEAAREFAERGAAHGGRLSPHDQLVFRAQRAWLAGDVAEAESLYNSITGTYPDDVEAWFHLGDLLFHSNPLRGRSAAEAREPFERVLRLEPNHLAAMVHLARIAGITGRRDEMLGLADRVVRASPGGDQALAMRALRVFAGEDEAAMRALAAELQAARAITVAIAFADVALYSGNRPGAELLARSFLQVARAPELQALCHTLLAHLALAGGRGAEAWRELERAQSLDHAWGLEMRGWFAALPLGDIPDEDRRGVRDELERWDPAAAPPSSFLVFAMHNDLHPAIRLWLLGLLDLRLGDAGAARGRAALLDALPSDPAGLVRGIPPSWRPEPCASPAAPPRRWPSSSAPARGSGSSLPSRAPASPSRAAAGSRPSCSATSAGTTRRRVGTGAWRSDRRTSWCLRGRRGGPWKAPPAVIPGGARDPPNGVPHPFEQIPRRFAPRDDTRRACRPARRVDSAPCRSTSSRSRHFPNTLPRSVPCCSSAKSSTAGPARSAPCSRSSRP
jgi:tetratricopeptide (TPR) repeat protein